MRRSGVEAFSLSAGVLKILPNCSTMTMRFVPGIVPASSGFLKVMLGNARWTTKGEGGSGELWRWEVVQGVGSAATTDSRAAAANRQTVQSKWRKRGVMRLGSFSQRMGYASRSEDGWLD